MNARDHAAANEANGKLIAAIAAFLQSPLGQELVQAGMSWLLLLITPKTN